jgi:hypothetical protein
MKTFDGYSERISRNFNLFECILLSTSNFVIFFFLDHKRVRLCSDVCRGCRKNFKDAQKLTPYQKKKYVWKMLYIYVLGYEVTYTIPPEQCVHSHSGNRQSHNWNRLLLFPTSVAIPPHLIRSSLFDSGPCACTDLDTRGPYFAARGPAPPAWNRHPRLRDGVQRGPIPQVDFGHMEALNLITAPGYSEKTVGSAPSPPHPVTPPPRTRLAPLPSRACPHQSQAPLELPRRCGPPQRAVTAAAAALAPRCRPSARVALATAAGGEARFTVSDSQSQSHRVSCRRGVAWVPAALAAAAAAAPGRRGWWGACVRACFGRLRYTGRW